MDDDLVIEDIIKAVETFEPKTIYMNQRTYDSVLELLDFVPENIVVSNLFIDNQALVLSKRQIENMNKGFGTLKPW